jgi:hypothetical protein
MVDLVRDIRIMVGAVYWLKVLKKVAHSILKLGVFCLSKAKKWLSMSRTN